MRIRDPTLSPEDFKRLEFAPLAETGGARDAYSLTIGGSAIGTMAPLLSGADDDILIDEDGSSIHPSSGIWTIEMQARGSDECRTHILWVAGPAGGPPELTGELAVWAALTVMRETRTRRFARG
jgi:hypothetical protein